MKLGHDFEKEYWDKNYSDPMSMDGIGNSALHVQYLTSTLALEQIEVNSIVDLGFGLGFLFETFLKAIPSLYKAQGIEPSIFAYNQAKKRSFFEENRSWVKLSQEDLYSWCKTEKKKYSRFDLGLCTSVFQYIPDQQLEFIIPILAKRIKYLYLTVPTDKELKRQREELDFDDPYALRRSRTRYLKWLSPHFTIVSGRLLESKVFFNDENTNFSEYLFRF